MELHTTSVLRQLPRKKRIISDTSAAASSALAQHLLHRRR